MKNGMTIIIKKQVSINKIRNKPLGAARFHPPIVGCPFPEMQNRLGLIKIEKKTHPPKFDYDYYTYIQIHTHIYITNLEKASSQIIILNPKIFQHQFFSFLIFIQNNL
jgi:hypothetical protein